MRIAAILSPTCLRYLSVLAVLCTAKHVENKPAGHVQDILVNDVEVFGSVGYVDDEEESKIMCDKINWNHGHQSRQMHDLRLNRTQNLKSGDSQQPCEGKRHLECLHEGLHLQIKGAEEHLRELKNAYARYARSTTWDIAVRQISNVSALPPPVLYLTSAIEEAKRYGSFPVLETNQENKSSANTSEGSFEYNNTENFVSLMSSMYEIVTVLTWLLDMVRLDLAISPDMDGSPKSEVLDNLIEYSHHKIISHDSPTLSNRLFDIRGITLSEMKRRNRKPNNDVLVKILEYKSEDVGGPDHAVRGLQVIKLLDECISILSQL